MPRDDRDPSFDRAQDESRGGGASDRTVGGASRRAADRIEPGEEVSREDAAAEESPGELERLLKFAANGDSTAWRAIVALYAPRVFGIVRAQCRDDELSEEIVQSTFCTLAAKIASYVESGRFESWLFRIAMNRLRDEMRRRSRQARSSTDEAFVGMPDTRERGGRGLAPEVRSKLELALARLSESDREIIDLRHTVCVKCTGANIIIDMCFKLLYKVRTNNFVAFFKPTKCCSRNTFEILVGFANSFHYTCTFPRC
jgi:RNA polymerase sigma-70 factor (ECF subfamily)